MLAIIGGSGLTKLTELKITQRQVIRTPYGEPSGPLVFGELDGTPIVFLARHGQAHSIAPHEVNYRANLWALKEQNVAGVIAVATVGGIRSEFGPGAIVIPDQIIDYTSGRKHTFFEAGAPVKHIDFTEPYDRQLREKLLTASETCKELVADGAVYAATQGPRLETAAEIGRLANDGADVVGMTGMPEASLARELELPYAAVTIVVNHAAGRGESRHGIQLEMLEKVVAQGMARVIKILSAVVHLS